jgi:hypothetical protein
VLSPDDAAFAARVRAIVDATDDQGAPLYDDLDVRDFIVACVFEVGLPLSRELEMLVQRFIIDEVEVDASEPTQDDILEGIKRYFQEFPLHPGLGKAIADLGREVFASGSGFGHDAIARNAMAAATGLARTARAPRAQAGASAGGPRARRGLR